MLKGFKPIGEAAAAVVAELEPTPPPIEYRPPAIRQMDDPQRERLSQALMEHEANIRRIKELEKLLNDALVNIRAKDAELQQMEIALQIERNRSTNYQAERDKAVQDRADLLAIFGSIQSQLAGFQFPSRKLEIEQQTETSAEPSAEVHHEHNENH